MFLVIGGAILLVLTVIVVLAWAHHKVTGILVTAIVVIGLIVVTCHYRATHEQYIEPPGEQPHAVMKFGVVSDPYTIPLHTVWIDDRDIRFDKRRTPFRGGFTEWLNGVLTSGSTQEGAYTLRASAGDHEIRVRYNAVRPGVISGTNDDLKLQVKCLAGETLFFMLSDWGAKISLWRVSESDFTKWAAYLQLPPDERLGNHKLYIERLVEMDLEQAGASEEEKNRLRPILIRSLEEELRKTGVPLSASGRDGQ